MVLPSLRLATWMLLMLRVPIAWCKVFDPFTAVPLLTACFGAAAAICDDSSLVGLELDRAVEATVKTTPVEV
jgi:hypothetical protein